MRNPYGVDIIEELSPTAFIIRCVFCEGYGTMGPSVVFPVCPLCEGTIELGVVVDGQPPLRQCPRCKGTGHLGTTKGYTPFPACDTCRRLGCRAHAGTLKLFSASELRLSVQHIIQPQITGEDATGGQLFSPFSNEDMKTMPTIEIFISHSACDKELAARLINLIRSALNLPSEAIRCTSVEGYQLPAGIPTNERLRQEIHESHVLIGIITPSAVTSTYVLFELLVPAGVLRSC